MVIAHREGGGKPGIKAFAFQMLSQHPQPVHMNLQRNRKSHVAHLFQGPQSISLSPSPWWLHLHNPAVLEWIRSRSVSNFLLSTASLKILRHSYSQVLAIRYWHGIHGQKAASVWWLFGEYSDWFSKAMSSPLLKSLPGTGLLHWKETLYRKFARMEIVNHTDDILNCTQTLEVDGKLH